MVEKMELPERTWADMILSGVVEIPGCPFAIESRAGKLFLINEIERHPRDLNWDFPEKPATGWVNLNNEFLAWCPLGGDKILRGEALPASVRSPFSGQIDLNPTFVISLISRGLAFVFCEDLYLLPDEDFEMNSFIYNLDGHENLHVFIGYRGHTRNHEEIITPSLYRRQKEPNEEKYMTYKRRETYVSNILKEAFWQKDHVALTDIQARGILQHHKIIGDTDILDLSYDINIAKWFSLNQYNAGSGRYLPKKFLVKDDYGMAYEESSLVYKIVVRMLGGTEKPLPIKLNGQEVVLVPRNISPLWSERPIRQKGFGLSGIFPDDQDRYGAILNITEFRYHPTAFLDGWDTVGGPTLTLFGKTYSATEDTSHLASQILPDEASWFQAVKHRIQVGVETHFQ